MTPAILYLVIAIILIGAELLIMQFSVFWLLLFGMGALFTSTTCWLVPELSWASSMGIFIVSSIVISALLYPPLNKWQKKSTKIPRNDAIGETGTALTDITPGQQGKVSWSGASFPAKLADGEHALSKGDIVKIKEIKKITFFVERVP